MDLRHDVWERADAALSALGDSSPSSSVTTVKARVLGLSVLESSLNGRFGLPFVEALPSVWASLAAWPPAVVDTPKRAASVAFALANRAANILRPGGGNYLTAAQAEKLICAPPSGGGGGGGSADDTDDGPTGPDGVPGV